MPVPLYQLGRHLVMAGLVTLTLVQTFCWQSGGNSPARSAALSDAPPESRFIVAFELSPEHGFALTWPFESMPPAPYESVLLVVERMPRGRAEQQGHDKSAALVAARHLKINGRRQKPYHLARGQAEDEFYQKQLFLVKLEQGRLRLALWLPPGFTLDSRQETAAIKLYQVAED